MVVEAPSTYYFSSFKYALRSETFLVIFIQCVKSSVTRVVIFLGGIYPKKYVGIRNSKEK